MLHVRQALGKKKLIRSWPRSSEPEKTMGTDFFWENQELLRFENTYAQQYV